MRSTALLAPALALLAGCLHLGPPRIPDCPGSIVATEKLEGDWLRHERIRVRADGIDESFGLVVQKRGPKLVLVGTNAFGATAFTLLQVGVEVTSDARLGRALPVPPENVLRDYHRARFLADAPPDFEGRSVAREPDGAVRIASAACGYEATLVPLGRDGAPRQQP